MPPSRVSAKLCCGPAAWWVVWRCADANGLQAPGPVRVLFCPFSLLTPAGLPLASPFNFIAEAVVLQIPFCWGTFQTRILPALKRK